MQTAGDKRAKPTAPEGKRARTGFSPDVLRDKAAQTASNPAENAENSGFDEDLSL